MTQIMHNRYHLGKYLGTNDQTVMHSVFHNGSPITTERPDERWAAQFARALYGRTRGPKQLVSRDADTGVEIVLEAQA